MGTALVVVGIVLVMMTFLLAFTTYGEICAPVGIVLIVIGAVKLGRRPPMSGAA